MRTHVHLDPESIILPEYHDVGARVKCKVTVAYESCLVHRELDNKN